MCAIIRGNGRSLTPLLVCALAATTMPLKPGTIGRLFFTPPVFLLGLVLFFFLPPFTNAVFFFFSFRTHLFCVCVLTFFHTAPTTSSAQDLHGFGNEMQVDLELRALLGSAGILGVLHEFESCF